MTEEYKKNLIDYATDMLNSGTPQEEDFNIKEISNIAYSSNDWKIVVDALNPYYNSIKGILSSERYDIYIMYGGYSQTASDDTKGFLIYLDRNGKPLKVILTEYRCFQFLKYDEETNRIYGILTDNGNGQSENASNKMYFAYFNNLFIINDDNPPIQTYLYEYNTPRTAWYRVYDIVKEQGASNYIILTSLDSYVYPVIYNLEINVGESNVLTTWQVNENEASLFLGAYAWFSNDTPHFKLICYKNYQNVRGLRLVQDNGSSLTYSNLSADVDLYTGSQFYNNSYFGINENNIYFVLKEQNYVSSSEIYYRTGIYQYDGTSVKLVYRDSLRTDQIEIQLMHDTDNSIYSFKYDITASNRVDMYLCNVSKNPNNWDYLDNYEGTDAQKPLLVRNYNLLSLISFGMYISSYPNQQYIRGGLLKIKCLSVQNHYNGIPYVSEDSLCPLYSNLYSNGSLIFSRNLYNISKQNNMTMSSVEIPNTYLNDIDITQNDLISETNLEMINNNQGFTKNIYEVVDLNFLNTIDVIDEDTGEEFEESAIKLNNSTTDGGSINYQNTPCNKYRINYGDGTNSINTFNWSSIDDLHKQFEISLYVDKTILSIDLISNDESVVYDNIPLQVEVGKTYTIKKKVRIGG
jgi:hypothetical protein